MGKKVKKRLKINSCGNRKNGEENRKNILVVVVQKSSILAEASRMQKRLV